VAVFLKEESNMQYPSLFKPLMLLTGATIILAGMHWAASFLVPVLLGVFFATLLTPLYSWLKRKRVPGGLALLISMIFLILLAVFLVLLVGNSLAVMVSELSTYGDQFSQQMAELTSKVSSLSSTVDWKQLLSSVNAGTLTGVLRFFLSTIAEVLKSSLLILLVTVFVLVEGPMFIKRLGQSFGPDHFLPQNIIALAHLMISYFGLRAVVNLFTALATGLMFWLVGIPYAGLWTVLTFFLSFIPYIGALAAGIPPVLLAFAQGGLEEALVVIVLMVVINAVTENILAPMIMGKGLSVSPTVVFLSFIFWMFILGGPGAFLAMPLTLAVILFLHSFAETHSLVEAIIVVEPVQKPARAPSKA
jgi:predicted PurR-regulated permease PerM